MSGIFMGEYFYDRTDKVCKICGSSVWDAYGDFYICLNCKKNLFEEDVLKQNSHYSPSIIIGYDDNKKDDSEIKYVIDSTGNTIIFKDEVEAKKYLVNCGLVRKTTFKSMGVDLYCFNDFYFIDQIQENCYGK